MGAGGTIAKDAALGIASALSGRVSRAGEPESARAEARARASAAPRRAERGACLDDEIGAVQRPPADS
ncbi:MAG: hypothetical protein IT372_13975 [Polyangiaceae bacterium]|nr:hypothetical protein [Polyangiaceae bacterium]